MDNIILIDLSTVQIKEKGNFKVLPYDLISLLYLNNRDNYKVFAFQKDIKDTFQIFQAGAMLEANNIIQDHFVYKTIKDLKEIISKVVTDTNANIMICCAPQNRKLFEAMGFKTFCLYESLIQYIRDLFRKKIYLIGPVNYPTNETDPNYKDLYAEAKKKIEEHKCFTVLSPPDICPNPTSLKESVGKNYETLLTADAAFCVYGWDHAELSKIEKSILVNLNIPVYMNYEYLFEKEVFKYEF